VTVFGTRASREGEPDYDEARQLGRLLAEAGFAVTTGGYGGAMEAANRGAREAGGRSRGITMSIFDPLPANVYLDEEEKVLNLFLRLERLIRDADAFVVLRGGIGTLTELSLTWGLLQTGAIARRPLVLVGDAWAQVLEAFRNHCIIQPADYDYVTMARTPEETVQIIQTGLK
jgi:uncharacterized protein (TIGR00730 family)